MLSATFIEPVLHLQSPVCACTAIRPAGPPFQVRPNGTNRRQPVARPVIASATSRPPIAVVLRPWPPNAVQHHRPGPNGPTWASGGGRRPQAGTRRCRPQGRAAADRRRPWTAQQVAQAPRLVGAGCGSCRPTGSAGRCPPAGNSPRRAGGRRWPRGADSGAISSGAALVQHHIGGDRQVGGA